MVSSNVLIPLGSAAAGGLLAKLYLGPSTGSDIAGNISKGLDFMLISVSIFGGFAVGTVYTWIF